MTWQVALTATAARERRQIDPPVRLRVDNALRSLSVEPRPPGSRKLVGSRPDWRIRVGDYRILYEVDEPERRVIVWRIAHRRDAYR